MKKIIDYIIVSHVQVPRYISDGWQPYGSPILSDLYTMYQAIVKYEDTPTDDQRDAAAYYEGLADRIGQ